MERCLSPPMGTSRNSKRVIFSISPVRLDEDKGDYWILDDLAVNLGAGFLPERAILQSESVIRELKREI